MQCNRILNQSVLTKFLDSQYFRMCITIIILFSEIENEIEKLQESRLIASVHGSAPGWIKV